MVYDDFSCDTLRYTVAVILTIYHNFTISDFLLHFSTLKCQMCFTGTLARRTQSLSNKVCIRFQFKTIFISVKPYKERLPLNTVNTVIYFLCIIVFLKTFKAVSGILYADVPLRNCLLTQLQLTS